MKLRVLLSGLASVLGLITFSGLAQTSVRIDSVFQVAKELETQGQFNNAISALDDLLKEAREENSNALQIKILLKMSYLHLWTSDYDLALSQLFDAQKLAEKGEDEGDLAEVYNSIGALHHRQKHYSEAKFHYATSLEIFKRLDNTFEIGKCYNNFGVLGADMGEPDTALYYHRKSLHIWNSLNNEGWLGICYTHLGSVHLIMEQYDSASYYLRKGIDIVETGKSKNQILLSLQYTELGNTKLASGYTLEAISDCEKALEFANQFDIMRYRQEACECLYLAYEKLRKYKKSLSYYKLYNAYRDSTFNEFKAEEMTRIEMDFKYSKEQLADSLERAKEKLEEDILYQKALSKEREGRNIALFTGIGILILAGALGSRLRYMRRSRAVIEMERNRSEELLLNILPGEIAEELKQKGTAEAKNFESVSILFTDFKGFTEISESLSAEQLVKEINECFKAFDQICDLHRVEKIKTIGDSYMAAGGLPAPSKDSTRNTVLAALEMNDFILKRKEAAGLAGNPAFEMRVGVHTGPVVAGIVGLKKFQYDVWGDTVNTASRMESNGQAGKVNISSTTYELLKSDPDLSFQARDKVNVKGKGEMQMYFVDRA